MMKIYKTSERILSTFYFILLIIFILISIYNFLRIGALEDRIYQLNQKIDHPDTQVIPTR